ncbi:MAG: LysR family transcriptional regulator [Pseudonocardiaceae bacterium]|nr:LysR family transcriptional regulator [Pseudonocardiaceae bacterium]
MCATPELRHLRAFVAVAEELHFSRAARKLHLAQQALSAQIRQLEQELGVVLFHRTTRKVELTQAGRTFLSHALPILNSVTTACEQTRRSYAGEVGQLSIAYTPTVAPEALPKFVLELHRVHPDLQLRMCEMWQTDSVVAVNSSRFDVGFARCPVIRGDLECVSIREEPLGIVLGCDHRLTTSSVVPIADLAAETLTIWPRSLSPGFYDRVVETLRAHRFDGRIQEFENLGFGVLFSDDTARVEVAAGRAFSVAFSQQYAPLPEGFAWRPLEPPPTVPLHMFWKKPVSATVDKLVHLVHEVARREGWIESG